MIRLAALVLLLPLATPARPDPAVADAVVSIEGTGCSLAPDVGVGTHLGDGLVLTAAHVVAETRAITVDGHAAAVVALDDRSDLALLRVPPLAERPSVEITEAAREGPAMVMRRRRGRLEPLDAPVTNLALVRLRDHHTDTLHERHSLVLGSAVRRGDSGSPVLDRDQRLAGVVYATSESGLRSYAVARREVADFLASSDLTAPGGPPPGC